MSSYAPLPAADAEDDAEVRSLVREIIASTAPPQRIAELDEREAFDTELFRALAESGLVQLQADVDGTPASHASQAVVLEELGATATSMAVALVVQYMGSSLLIAHGTPEQRDRYLAPLFEGAHHMSFALTEPGGGTDVARAMRTRAEQCPDGSWVVNGAKLWISGAADCGFYVLLARTSAPERAAIDGITMFLVPADTPGISVSELDTIAIHGLSTCEVGFADVVLPADAVLGEVGRGFRQVLGTLNGERLSAAAVALGIARGAHESALGYVREREAFGRPIGGFQVLQHRLVDDAVRIETTRALLQRGARAADGAEPAEALTAMAKLSASEAAVQAAEHGMRALGGSGLSREFPMQRYFRDARLYTFAPLTDEMTRNFLGEHYLRLPRSY